MNRHIFVVAATLLGALTLSPPDAAAQANGPARNTAAGAGKTWTVPC